MSTLLLLDDDRDFRKAIVPALEAKGHTVLQAHRGAEASALLRGQSVDLMIVDGLLPDTDGPTWIARQRALGNDTPAVFVSAFWRDLGSFNRLTRDLRVALVAHKPVAPGLFADQIDLLLNGPPPAPEAPTAEAPPPEEPSPQELFRQLQAEYARELPAKLRELAQAVELAQAEPDSPVAFGDARGRAHRLRGTAGTYGFRTVGEAAGRVEDALTRVRGPQDWSAVHAALQGALSAADAAAQSTDARAAQQRSFAGRLLVVSVDAGFASLAQARGRGQLIDVDACATTAQALAHARISSPDAALVDGPAESAAAFARDLRAVPGCESVAVGFVGEGAGALDRVAAVHAGASVYLSRPVSPEALDAAARQLVGPRQARQPRVLVLDDDPAFGERVAGLLRTQGMVAGFATDPVAVLDALETWQPDLLVLDVMMPGINGFDVCRMLRVTPRWQELPVLIVSAHSEAEVRVAAYRAGADDFAQKPLGDEELLARVRVRLDRARAARERFDRDPATGLLLRRPFIEAMGARLLEAARHQRTLAVALLDLDDAKRLEQVHGHLAADGLASSLGALIARRFRAEDVRGRWGPSEFVLAYPGETPQTIHGALGRLLEEFRAMEFRAEDGSAYGATFSAGVAGFPEDGASLEQLLRAADRRMATRVRNGSILISG